MNFLRENALLVAWIAFTLTGMAAVVTVFVWALRSGQFTDQDRARYLPLTSGIPEDSAVGKPAGSNKPGRDENVST
jgi:cbb3-type cytochrome oxidase maturation protein